LQRPSAKNNVGEKETFNKQKTGNAAGEGSPTKDNRQQNEGNFNSQAQEVLAKAPSNKTLP
jgi:hypothetical protein